MAQYNLRKPERVKNFQKYVERAIKNEEFVEITKVNTKSLDMNGYFHVIVPYFALKLARSYNYTRETLIKKIICPELFTEKRYDRNTGEEYDHPLGWADLGQHKAHLVIAKVHAYANIECGIRLPEPQDLIHEEVQRQIRQELDDAKEFLY